MKKIVDFGEYIKEFIKFPHGGTLGGEHQKTIKDDDFDKLPKDTQIPQSAYNIEREKNKERKISIMGDTLNGYHDQHFIDSLIGAVNSFKIDNGCYYFGAVKDYLECLSQNVIDHFDIDITTDDGINDFIDNKFELFKRSYEMWKEIDKKYPGERYGR